MSISKKVKVKKKFWQKGKSKFLAFRSELQHEPDISISGKFAMQEQETIQANRLRRAKLKINQPHYPSSYYKDCFVNQNS